MGLKEVLAKMKLVELEEAPPAARSAPAASVESAPPARPRVATPPGPPDLAAILRSIPGVGPIEDVPATPTATPPPGLATMAAAPTAAPSPPPATELPALGELPDFPTVYQAAQISDPPHGFSSLKVLEILSSPGFASLDAKAKAGALLGFLGMNPSGPVPIHEVIQDAVRRDQALDRFEELLQKKLAQRGGEIEKESAALQAEIDALTIKNRDKMEANRRALDQETAKLREWQARKRVEERRLFEAVAPFVEANPVSTAAKE
jgi:hypothetical protein